MSGNNIKSEHGSGSSSGLSSSLLDPSCYNHPVAPIECIETHISWVFLTGEFAYKLKKPLKLGFLDFSTLEKRQFYCMEELRLNRRFAPDLYLDVTPICGTTEHPRLNGSGSVLDYAVKMHQFPQTALLDRKLRAGELTPSRIDSIARKVARFHLTNCGNMPPGLGDPEHILQQAMDNFEQIREENGWTDTLTALQSWSAATFALHLPYFKLRRQSGFIRECHGDLHLGNMAWLDEHPVLFDCIEFSPDLRWIDIISDLAFAVMDFHDHGKPELAHRFLNAWLEQTGDHDGLALLPWYLVYRAMVRAKVAHIRARQAPHEYSDFTDYLALAERFTRPSPKWLLITHGYSGSGKTTVSQHLLEHTGAIRIRADIERKRLFGLSPEARSHSPIDQGIYTPEAHRMTYQHLETLARTIIQAGYPVIVDAAFLKRTERNAFHTLADSLGVPFRILEVKADEAELRMRVRAREQSGADASEATLAVLEKQLQFSETIAEDEYSFRFVCHSGENMADELHRLEHQISSMT